MNSRIASVKINQRMEKLDSSDYDNITREQKEEAVNKAALEFARVKFKNEDETSRFSIDDIQILLKEQKLSKAERDIYIESGKIPIDYLFFKRLSPRCKKGNCENVFIKSTLVEEANVDDLIQDYSTQPSFDFEQTFHTIFGNRFRVYHNKDFDIDQVKLIYYRKPLNISFAEADRAKDWEWKDDVAEFIIDMAVVILAGDTEGQSAYQTAMARQAKLQ